MYMIVAYQIFVVILTFTENQFSSAYVQQTPTTTTDNFVYTYLCLFCTAYQIKLSTLPDLLCARPQTHCVWHAQACVTVQFCKLKFLKDAVNPHLNYSKSDTSTVPLINDTKIMNRKNVINQKGTFFLFQKESQSQNKIRVIGIHT